MSSSSKGKEREQFINLFLSNVLPLPYRFGTGDITDFNSRRSGQADVVVEYPFLPSVPSIGGDVRLYLAESVAAVVEVKSDVAGQWEEAVQTAKNIKILERNLGSFTREMHGGSISYTSRGVTVSGMTLDGRMAPPGTRAGIEFGPDGMKILGQKVDPTLPIPVFAVGYRGWKNIETIQARLSETDIDGVLILDNDGLFVSSHRYGGILATGSPALWAFICCLHVATKELSKISTNPLTYATQ